MERSRNPTLIDEYPRTQLPVVYNILHMHIVRTYKISYVVLVVVGLFS